MKVAIRKNYGDFDIIEIAEMTTPVPQNDEILIKVYATTVNRTDCAVVTGSPFVFRFFIGFPRPKRLILGTDFAGIVTEVGKNVTDFKVGDKVCGFNDQGLQSQAEFMVISEKGNVIKMPENFTYEQAAASFEGGHYAINFLNKVTINAQQKVLVNGATGGIGSAMVQFLKFYGCYVTAVGNTKNMDLIRDLGADKVYNYEKEDFTKDELRYDYVFDAVGKSTYGKCKRILKPNGAYISSELGPGNENLYLPLITKLFYKQKVIFPMPTDIKASLNFIKSLAEKNQFTPVIEKSYPLDKLTEAYKYVNSGQKTGNVVVKIF
jgi:NADPH:quinone reductase-like Zn-dependent oxidoreductase